MAKNQNHRWLIIKPSGSLLIRFDYQKQRYQFAPVHGGRFDNPQDLAIANKVASEIELSVKLGNFTGLDPWKPKTLIKPEIIQSLTLKDIWQQYKIAKADKVSKASQVSTWLQVDRCLHYLENTTMKLQLEYIAVHDLIVRLQAEYSYHVIKRTLDDLHAACNLAVRRKLITSNPVSGYKDELGNTAYVSSKECYSREEVQTILETFKTHPEQHIRHYANFIEFLFLTGVRPQMAIALAWQDIQWSLDFVTLTNGYTNGILKCSKTGRVVRYPLYPQLRELLEKTRDCHECIRFEDLVFPSTTGGYINLKNFTRRIWKPVITKLVSEGKLTEYLPTYHCRHTAASMLAGAGVPATTIAALLDTSEQMLNKHYFDNDQLTTSLNVENLY